MLKEASDMWASDVLKHASDILKHTCDMYTEMCKWYMYKHTGVYILFKDSQNVQRDPCNGQMAHATDVHKHTVYAEAGTR